MTNTPVAPRTAADAGLLRATAMALLIVLATAVVFSRVCNPWRSYDFVAWDDLRTVAANRDFNPPTWSNFFRYWKAPALDLYIPVTYTAWMGVANVSQLALPDERGVGLDAYPFHALNLIVHIFSALLVFAILRLLVSTEWAAMLGALVFALHPVQVEPVAWVSGLKDTLSGMFSLLAVWQYLLYATRRQDNEEASSWQWPYLLATFAFLLALLSKPTAVTLPLIVGILDLFLLKRPWAEVSGPLWIWLLMALFFLVLGRMAQPATPLEYIPPLWLRPIIAGFALAFHLYHLVYPVGLAADYSLSPERLLAWGLAYVAWVVPAVVLLVCWLTRNRLPWLSAAAGIFAAALLPVLGLLPFDFQYYSTVADRYTYLAMLGAALAVAFVLSRWPKPWLAGLVIAGIVALGVLSFRQTAAWKDTETLFRHTLQVNPRSVVAHQMLGNMAATQRNYDEAIRHYREALITKPDDPETEYNLANLFVKTERLRDALPHYENAVRRRPSDPRFSNNYGDALRRLADLETSPERRLAMLNDAVQKYSDAVAAAAATPEDPMNAIARANLAMTHLQIAQSYYNAQNWAAAIPHFEAAIKVDPGNPDIAAAQGSLAECRRRLGARP